MGAHLRRLLALGALMVAAATTAYDGPWMRLPAAGRPPQVGVYLFLWYRPTGSGWGNGNTLVPPVTPRPALGWYDSRQRDVIRAHLDEISATGFDFVIVDLVAPDAATWGSVRTLFQEVAAYPLRVAVMLDGLYREPAAVQQAWLRQVRDEFGGHPRALRVQGKPLLLLFSSFDPVVVEGASVRNVYWSPDYRNGYNPFYRGRSPSSPTYPIDWPFWASGLPPLVNGVVPVMPGYDDRALGRADPVYYSREDGRLYAAQWERALRLRPDLITVYSWNEHFEQTAIEPTDAWGRRYLDLTRQFLQQARLTRTEG